MNFTQIRVSSIFNRVLNERFSYLKPFKSTSVCRVCLKLKSLQKRKIISTEQKKKIQNELDKHNADVKNVKDELLKCIHDTELNDTEVITFESQRPLELPSGP